MSKVKEYNFLKKIGEGSFGKVYLVQKKNEPEYLVAKKINLLKMTPKECNRYLKNEREIMKQLNHENVVKFYDYFEEESYAYFIIECCNGGSLSKHLKEYKLKHNAPFPQDIIQNFAKQIVKGLNHIHSKGIIHRDIKLDNILLNFKNNKFINYEYATVKIIDFGLSTQGLGKSIVGSPIYMDPTILAKFNRAGGYYKLEKYDEKTDIWSLGAICYEMLTGENLFKARDLPELQEQAKKGVYFLPINFILSHEIISFLNAMLQYDPKNRASTEQLLRHDFLTKDIKDFRPANISQIAYKIDKGVLTINFIDNESFKKIFNPSMVGNKDNKQFILPEVGNMIFVDFENLPRTTELNENIKQYIHELLDEYEKAEKYFKNNKLITQEEDAKNKIILIKTMYNKIKLGEKVDINNLPKKITPEYIYGCSSEERNKIFEKAINYVKEKKQKNTNREKIKKYDNTIAVLEKSFNDKWTPPPKIIEKKNTNLKKYQIKFVINKINGINDNINFNILLKVNELNTFKKEVHLKVDNNFTKEWIWDFKENDWLIIDNNNENFVLYIDFGNNFNKTEINIENIKLGHPLSFDVPTPNISKINLILAPIIPTGNNEIKGKIELFIEAIYPTFKEKEKSFISKSSLI